MPILKKLSTAILSILFLFITSCNNTKDPLKDFANLRGNLLRGEEIHLQNDSVLYLPYNFQVYDSLGVFNDNSGRTAVTLVNLKNGRLVKKFIFSGDKPSEFDINAISINGVADNKADFTVLQINPPCKIVRYNWAHLLNSANYNPAPFYYTDKYGYYNSFLINDSTIFGQLSYSKFDKKLFAITNIKSNKLITGLDLPRLDDKTFDGYYQDSIYYGALKSLVDIKLRMRPGSKHEFVYFTANGALFQIFYIDNDYTFKVKFEKVYYLPLFNVIRTAKYTKSKMLPHSKRGFNDVTVTDKKIYALFSGSEKGDVFCDDVLVYNWEGTPVEKIKLDRKCRNITIDENNPKIMYGLYGTSKAQVVKYILQ